MDAITIPKQTAFLDRALRKKVFESAHGPGIDRIPRRPVSRKPKLLENSFKNISPGNEAVPACLSPKVS